MGTRQQGTTNATAMPLHAAHNSPDPELQAPVLGPCNAVELQEEEEGRPNFWPCSMNLTKVILGAGIMAIPHAVALLGVVYGIAALVVVGLLTWWTLHGAPSEKTGPCARPRGWVWSTAWGLKCTKCICAGAFGRGRYARAAGTRVMHITAASAALGASP